MTSTVLAAGESTSLDLPPLSGFENTMLWVILGISLVALVYAYALVKGVLAKDEGTEKMQSISLAIREGANAYLTRQFKTLAVFVAVLSVVLLFFEVGERAYIYEVSFRIL